MGRNFLFFKFTISCLFISSLHPWFVWDIKGIYLSIVACICSIWVCRSGFISISAKSFSVSIIYLILSIWTNRGMNYFGFGEILINWIVFLIILGLRNDYRRNVLVFITKCTAVILGISLPFFLIHLVGVPLPHISVTNLSSFSSIDNYFLFVIKGSAPRFQGPFLEPGFMTMGTAILLFLNKYKLKNKYVLVLFISQILSLSIAGYVLLIVGYFISIILANKANRLSMLLTAFFMLLSSSMLLTNLMGEEIVEERIVGRLQWEDGKLSGDDRSSDYLDYVYENVVNSELKWVGTEWNSELSEKGVAGYKLFVVKYGYVGLLLSISLYLSSIFIIEDKKKMKWQISLVFITLLMLFQNAYPTMWALLITTIYGLNLLNDNRYERE